MLEVRLNFLVGANMALVIVLFFIGLSYQLGSIGKSS